MCGLVQSAKLWYETITGVLKQDGYTPNPMDACVWNKWVNGNQVTIVIYVHDLAISCKDRVEVHRAMNMIKDKFIDIKTKESNEMSYLGMNIKIAEDGIHVSMASYIAEMVKEFDGVKDYSHPADDKLYVNDGISPAKDKKWFHKMVAKLLYLCKRGRPDIALPVHYLCTRVQNPTDADEKKLNRIMGFLKATIDHTRKISSKPFKRIEAYIDAAHACHEDGFGQSGGAIIVGDAMVEVITRKQKCAARDSTEAELVALEALLLDVEWHDEWFEGQGYKLEKPLIYQDNTSTITLVTKGGGTKLCA